MNLLHALRIYMYYVYQIKSKSKKKKRVLAFVAFGTESNYIVLVYVV